MESLERMRWLLALGLLGLAAWAFHEGLDTSDKGVVAFFLMGVTLVAGASMFLSVDIAHWLSRPFINFIDSIYLPGGFAKKPPLDLNLAIYYERHFRGEDAFAVYQKMARYYPHHLPAYAGAIRVLEGLLDEFEEASAWRTKAGRLFGREEVNAAVAKTAQQLYDERPVTIAGLIAEDGLTLPAPSPSSSAPSD